MLACEDNYHHAGFCTVMMWYLDLHSTTTGDLHFTKSACGSSLTAATSPFQEDESLLVQFETWARSDLEHLTIKKSTEWTNKKLLAGWTMENLKAMNISVPVKENVVARWMNEAGFCYAAYKKSYYVDRHEAPDVVESRNKYLVSNFEDEIHERCWVQLTVPQFHAVMKKNEKGEGIDNVRKFIMSRAHTYQNEQNVPMVEVNIHDFVDGHDFEPQLSIRNETRRELVIFGQDEAIFRTTHLNTNTWYIDGQSSLRSKGMGVGVMVSSFNSYRFGFGMNITNEQLQCVNTYRRAKCYCETNAAIFLNGSPAKPSLTESPFLCMLEHGQGKDGYWTYNHMVFQLEDITDCMTILYPDPNNSTHCQFDLPLRWITAWAIQKTQWMAFLQLRQF